MNPIKLIALGAALFGIGMTMQQLALSWVLFHSSDMLLSQIDNLDQLAEETLVELEQERGDHSERETSEILKEIKRSFGEKEIATKAAQTEAAAGSFGGERWRKWTAAFGILLKVAGGIVWLLSFLKMLRMPAPSLPEQICGTVAASMLLLTVLFDHTAASVGEAASQTSQLESLRGGRSMFPFPKLTPDFDFGKDPPGAPNRRREDPAGLDR